MTGEGNENDGQSYTASGSAQGANMREKRRFRGKPRRRFATAGASDGCVF
jgi:hypothetical protein